MKEELYKKLLEIINSSQTFLSDQLPDMAQQLILYERLNCLACAIMFSILMIFSALICCRCWKRRADYNANELWSGIILIFAVLFFIEAFSNTFDIIQSYVAPKAFLIKSLTSGCHK